MRKVYVINLDTARILFVLGFFLLIIALAILLGYALSPSQKEESIPNAIPIIKEAEEVNPKESPVLEHGFIEPINKENPPPNQEKILENKFKKENSLPIYSDDPFINPPPSKKKSQLSLDSYYTVQVGAFVHEKDALRLEKLLKQKGFEDVRVEQGSRYWFVRMGKAKSKEKLAPLVQKLKAENFESLIRRLP